jgi:hypothetical protein
MALHDVRVSKDILVANPEGIERYRDVAVRILRPVLREG